MLGTTELLLLGGLALLLFGGKKVPEMMRGLGQGVKEFKKGMNEVDGVVKSEEEVEKHDDLQADETNSSNTQNVGEPHDKAGE